MTNWTKERPSLDKCRDKHQIYLVRGSLLNRVITCDVHVGCHVDDGIVLNFFFNAEGFYGKPMKSSDIDTYSIFSDIEWCGPIN